MAVDLSVIVPCWNEEGNVPELCARVLAVFEVGGLAGELVLVDDGSRDGTRAAIERAAGDGRVRGVFHGENRGIAASWKSGLAAARGRLCAVMDADLQYQPEDLLRMLEGLDERVDVVQGWRSAVGRARGPRYYYSRGFNWLLNTVFAMDLEDNKSGFFLCRREVLADLLDYRGDYFYWQSFVMVAAKAKGYRCRQIEALFEERKQGRSFLDGRALEASAKSLVDVSKAVGEYRFAGAGGARWRAYLAAFDASHWMITREVERHVDELARSERFSAAELGALQDDKLRRLVRHAYDHVPFYRARMKARGLDPSAIRGRADLAKLELTSKDDLRRELYFGALSDDHDKSQVSKITTSGSTGEPFVCYADRAQLEFRWAATLRAQEWTGYRFGDPTVRLWHQTIGLSRLQAARERLDALLSNRHFVPVFELSDARVEETLRLIERVEPALVDGYAEALDFIAHRAGPLAGKVGAVMSSAQTLPEASRRAIERAFGCAVFDKYGSREFSGIAYECAEHAGHHVVAEGYIVEILREGRPARPGETGEVVITDLNNHCMPFIRYRIGDLARALPDEPCACGRASPRIGEIEGRVQSIIQGEGGRYLPGTFFAHYFKDLAHAVRRYRVVQREPGAIVVSLVPGGRFTAATKDEIVEALRARLGRGMRIAIEMVPDVAMVASGKRVGSISSLPVDFQSERAPVVALGEE